MAAPNEITGMKPKISEEGTGVEIENSGKNGEIMVVKQAFKSS